MNGRISCSACTMRGKIKRLFSGATNVGFGAADLAERLAGSVAGTVLPFAFHPDLILIADPSVTSHQELLFNAARLDRSVALRTSDNLAIAQPRLEQIAVA